MLDDNTDEFIEARRDLEDALNDVRCIGRTLIMLTESGGDDFSDVFSYLGLQLSYAQPYLQTQLPGIRRHQKPPPSKRHS